MEASATPGTSPLAISGNESFIDLNSQAEDVWLAQVPPRTLKIIFQIDLTPVNLRLLDALVNAIKPASTARTPSNSADPERVRENVVITLTRSLIARACEVVQPGDGRDLVEFDQMTLDVSR